MKIAIDAKWLYHGPVSGKVVLESLLKHWHKQISDDLQIYLILDSRDGESEKKYAPYGYHFVYLWGKVNLVANVFLSRKLRKYKFDIVLFQNFAPFFSRANYSLFIFDVLFDDYPQYFSLKERAYFKLIKPSAAKAQRVFTISESEKERLIKRGYSKEENTIPVHMGVDIDRFKNADDVDVAALKEKYSIGENYIIYYGRLNDRKNIINLIKASKKQYKEDKTMLVIVGPKDSKFTHSHDASFGEEHIRMTGYLPDEELAALLKASAAFCYISYAEGFGLPPLEAMCLGVPTVVSNTTSLPEVCGDASIYVDPYSIDSIYQGISKALSSKELRNTLVTKGYLNVQRFSWERSADEIIEKLK